MKNFNQRGSEGGGFNRPKFGGGNRRDRGPVTMHQAICAECGQSCQVPFRPTGDKPVYCSNCFGKHGGDDRSPRRDFGRPNPNFSRPSFGRSRENNSNNNNDGLKHQLDSISIKLDQLTRSIDQLVESKAEPVVPKKKVVAKKTKKN